MRNLIIAVLVIAVFFLGRYLYMKPKFMIGSSAPNITASLENGEDFKLDEVLKNNVVLLDFWGSWCGPCRVENPSLVKLYEEFHRAEADGETGFEIVSVGIETKKDRWLKAIEKDGLDWPYHILQLDRFSSEIPTQYGIHEIPTTYLINTSGKIIGVNMTYNELRNSLINNLNSK